MAVGLLVCGCDNEVQQPRPMPVTLSLPTGEVTVSEVTRSEKEKRIGATVVCAEGTRNVTIIRCKQPGLPEGFEAQLSDGDDVLFSIAYGWGRKGQRVWFVERAGSDVMSGEMWRIDNRVVEEYDINGATFRAEYAAADAIDPSREDDSAVGGGTAEGVRGEEYRRAREAFEVFYDNHIASDLRSNADGELLASLLTNEAFAKSVTGGKDPGGPHLMGDKTADRICGIATLCGFLKCWAGGIANPLCVACMGTSIACVMAEMACWFADCGW